jgi:hypothetical protein
MRTGVIPRFIGESLVMTIIREVKLWFYGGLPRFFGISPNISAFSRRLQRRSTGTQTERNPATMSFGKLHKDHNSTVTIIFVWAAAQITAKRTTRLRIKSFG